MSDEARYGRIKEGVENAMRTERGAGNLIMQDFAWVIARCNVMTQLRDNHLKRLDILQERWDDWRPVMNDDGEFLYYAYNHGSQQFDGIIELADFLLNTPSPT